MPQRWTVSNYVKYPRTPHLPWSNSGADDVRLYHSIFKPKDIVVATEKLDGENTTMYHDHIHARSLDSRYHWSRTWVKDFWAKNIAHQIPENIRIVGENMYATHTIRYTNLRSYFYGISVWEDDVCLDWPSTLEWFDSLGIESVPVLGWDSYEHISLSKTLRIPPEKEGYVLRRERSFTYDEFPQNVAKFVHKTFVVSEDHWVTKSAQARNDLI